MPITFLPVEEPKEKKQKEQKEKKQKKEKIEKEKEQKIGDTIISCFFDKIYEAFETFGEYYTNKEFLQCLTDISKEKGFLHKILKQLIIGE